MSVCLVQVVVLIFAHEDPLIIPSSSIAPVYGSFVRYATSRSYPVPMLLFDWSQLQCRSGTIPGKSSYMISTLFGDRAAGCMRTLQHHRILVVNTGDTVALLIADP
jgi:hypothetical protein